MPEVQWLVAAFPNFVRYVVVGFALAALFLWIYTLITPWREFALIRAGNSAAATALAGALLGFSLPLANTIAHSVSLTDVVLWALVALVVQAIVHVGMRLVLPGLKQAIESNHAAAGIAAGGFAVDGRCRGGRPLFLHVGHRRRPRRAAQSVVSYKPFLSRACDLGTHRHAGLLGDDIGRQQSHVRPEPARRLRRNGLARRLDGFELNHAP